MSRSSELRLDEVAIAITITVRYAAPALGPVRCEEKWRIRLYHQSGRHQLHEVGGIVQLVPLKQIIHSVVHPQLIPDPAGNGGGLSVSIYSSRAGGLDTSTSGCHSRTQARSRSLKYQGPGPTIDSRHDMLGYQTGSAPRRQTRRAYQGRASMGAINDFGWRGWRTDDEPSANAEISDDQRRRTHAVVPHRRRALRQRGFPTTQVSSKPCGMPSNSLQQQVSSARAACSWPRRRCARFP